MRFISFTHEGDDCVGVVDSSDNVINLNKALGDAELSMKRFISMGEEGFRRAKEALDDASHERIPMTSLQLQAPVPNPSKILCIGLNYKDHAKELNLDLPSRPCFFVKLTNSLCAHGDVITLPPQCPSNVDYEAELVLVIGRYAKNVSVQEASRHIWGVTCGNDISARDWQMAPPTQWTMGKTFDTFAPTGPYVVSADSFKDGLTSICNLDVKCRLNGQIMQESNTSEFIFNPAEIVSFLSQITDLVPGDLIFTGTPGGIGFKRDPPAFLKHDDCVEVEISGVGTLTNKVGLR